MKKLLLISIIFVLTISLLGCAKDGAPLPVYTEYTVRYYLESSTEQLAEDRVVTGFTVDSRITENAIRISGYTVVGNEEQSLTLAAINNSITFHYRQEKTADNSGSDQIEDTISVTTNSIDEFFDMTKDELRGYFGESYKIGGLGEGGFEYHHSEDTGFRFAWEDDTLAFIFIWPPNNFEVNGARVGMDFMQIQEHLGSAEIIETWIEHPENVAYKLEYLIGKCAYSFYSTELDGSNSQLNISRCN